MLLLQRFDSGLDDWVDGLLGVRILAVAAGREPLHEVEVGRAIQREGIAVEHVDDQRQVAVGGELVSNQLAVDPDADDIGDEQDGGIFVRLLGGWRSKIAIPFAGDLDRLAGRLAAGEAWSVPDDPAALRSSRRVERGKGLGTFLGPEGGGTAG
jgi:hypothetical protein